MAEPKTIRSPASSTVRACEQGCRPQGTDPDRPPTSLKANARPAGHTRSRAGRPRGDPTRHDDPTPAACSREPSPPQKPSTPGSTEAIKVPSRYAIAGDGAPIPAAGPPAGGVHPLRDRGLWTAASLSSASAAASPQSSRRYRSRAARGTHRSKEQRRTPPARATRASRGMRRPASVNAASPRLGRRST